VTAVDDVTTVSAPDRSGGGGSAVRPVPVPGAAVDVVLAEFAALRNEIDQLAGAQRKMINLNITAVATIVGLVLAQRADPHLLLALPVVSAAIGLVYQWYVLHAKHIGDYIDAILRPLLVAHTGDERVLGWEHQLRTTVYRRRGSGLAGRLSYLLLFPAVPAVALAATIAYLDTAWHWLAWTGGLALFGTQVTVWWLQVRRWVCWV
jgi:hypothetical protein